MTRPMPSPREGRWRALIWLAFGDVFLLACGSSLVLSPLVLALLLPSWLWLVLLALPSLSWFFYGVMVLRACAAVPLPTSNGILLESSKVPVLMEELERLRLACDAPAFTAVYVNADLNASIYQTGSRGGQSKHVLVLGLPLLALLTKKQAAAVLAHEYAHISRSHGHLARWAYMARHRWTALGELHERNHRLITAPIRLFLSWYVPRVMDETLEFSRRCEAVADAQAIEVCGREAAFEAEAALALRQRALSRQFWPATFAQAGGEELTQIRPFSQLLMEPVGSRPRGGAQAAVWLHEGLCQKPDPYSTHPAFYERIEAIGFDPEAPLPDRLPWCIEETSAATDWLGAAASGIAAQLDTDWRENAAQAWSDARAGHAYRRRQFSQLLRRREQQVFDEQDWLQLAQLAAEFDQAGTLRAEAIAQGLRHSPAEPALLQLKAGDLELSGDIDGAIALWHRIEQGRPSSSSTYQTHRRLCELYLRAGDKSAAERHRRIADELWASEDAGQSDITGPFPHGMDASELALLQSRLQPLFQHARAIWLCRGRSAGTANSPQWLLYVQAYDDWFMRLVGKLTGEEDINASACKRLLERLQARLHIDVEVRFIGPSQQLPAGCTHGSLIAQAGSAIPAATSRPENA